MVEAQVVFEKTLDVDGLNSKHVAGIDLGLHNIVTLVSTSTAPILISGDKMIRININLIVNSLVFLKLEVHSPYEHRNCITNVSNL